MSLTRVRRKNRRATTARMAGAYGVFFNWLVQGTFLGSDESTDLYIGYYGSITHEHVYHAYSQ
jgi:hypothetical protein